MDKDWKDYTLDEIKTLDVNSRMDVAQYGTDAQRDILLTDEIASVRRLIAEYGTDAQRERLLNDPSSVVRMYIAQYGNDEQRDKLLNDSDTEVRRTIAEYGNDAHRDKLLNDSESEVRAAVAEFGHQSHIDALMNDEDSSVRSMAMSGIENGTSIINETDEEKDKGLNPDSVSPDDLRIPKYELIPTEDSDKFVIRALHDFGDVKAGDLGGVVSGYHNLSHDGNCWIYPGSEAVGNSIVTDNATLSNGSRVEGNVIVFGNAKMDASSLTGGAVLGDNAVLENSHLKGESLVFGDAKVQHAFSDKKCLVFGDTHIGTENKKIDLSKLNHINIEKGLHKGGVVDGIRRLYRVTGSRIKRANVNTDGGKPTLLIFFESLFKSFSASYKHGLHPERTPEKFHAIKSEKINWKELEKFGVTKKMLEDNGDLHKLLEGEKTGLLKLKLFNGQEFECRLSVVQRNGKYSLAVHPRRHFLTLNEYMGHSFTREEKDVLAHDGHLGKPVSLNGRECLVSIDPVTNELHAYPMDKIKIPDVIRGLELTDEQKKSLAMGRKVALEGLTSKSGKKYDCIGQFNAVTRSVELIFDTKVNYKQRHEQNQNFSKKSDNTVNRSIVAEDYTAPQSISGKVLTNEQRQALESGKTLFLKGLKDRSGNLINCYVRAKAGEPGGVEFFKNIPPELKKKEIKPQQEQKQKEEQKKKCGFKRSTYTSTKKSGMKL